jgi:predicted alpha/beta superfamily hydrolase
MTPRKHLQAAPHAQAYGELERVDDFRSRLLGGRRRLIVYLPPGYRDDSSRRHPVLYMQDGQNLFDGRTSFVPGQHWHLNETADNLARDNSIEAPIIVGVYNACERRIEEYTPTRDPNFKVGGGADLYGRALAEELKPFIDARYRTKPGREHTGVGGSSLGGLVSLHLGLRRADVFGRVVAMSPSLWWDNCRLLRDLDRLFTTPPVKVWLDGGTSEGSNTDCNAEAARDALVARGMRSGSEVEFMRVEGGRHSEQDWAHRVHHALRFAYAPDAGQEPRVVRAAPTVPAGRRQKITGSLRAALAELRRRAG